MSKSTNQVSTIEMINNASFATEAQFETYIKRVARVFNACVTDVSLAVFDAMSFYSQKYKDRTVPQTIGQEVRGHVRTHFENTY